MYLLVEIAADRRMWLVLSRSIEREVFEDGVSRQPSLSDF